MEVEEWWRVLGSFCPRGDQRSGDRTGQIVVGWLGWRSCWGGRVIDGYIGGSRDTGRRTKRGVYELLVYGDALATFTKMARILGFH